jgi:pyrroloquinoline quinone (PQQ) biosynthesis protein C
MTDTTQAALEALRPFMEKVGKQRTFATGEQLIEQGRHDQQAYYIISGETEVVRDGEAIRRIEAGDIVGEFAFIDNRPRVASVFAAVETVVIEIDRQDLIRSSGEDLGPLSEFLQIATKRMQERSLPDQTGDISAFLDRISQEALNHRAVHHTYLQSLANGEYPDMRWALADFGRQYYGYSAHFPRYLTKTISQLTNPAHRNGLMQNLIEESGSYGEEDLAELAEAGIDPEWVVDVPHPELFKRFCDSLAVDLGHVTQDSTEVTCWREMFLDVLGEGSPAQAVGALGIGTEGVVSTMYQNFLPALDQIEIAPRDAVFFPLHAMVDDHHQETLLEIAKDFADTSEGRRDLIKGMRKALFLRAGFWDWLHARALDPERAQNTSDVIS